MLSKIYQSAREQGVRLMPYAIGFSDAVTVEVGGEYGIFLDFSQFQELSAFQEALAHEIGHCATGCTHKLSSPWDLVQKHEFKANRWAFEHYLPVDELKTAMRAGLTEPWQLAEWYGFPEEYIRLALRYWIECRGVDFKADDASAYCV